MAKKQAVSDPTSAAGAALARVAKAPTSRTRSGKHSKAAVAVEKVETPITAAEVEQILMAPELPVPAEDPREAISRLAYGYWEERGYQDGDPVEDWVRAEEEYRRLATA